MCLSVCLSVCPELISHHLSPSVFTREELCEVLVPVLDQVYNQDPEAFPFKEPVDPKALGIPVSVGPCAAFCLVSHVHVHRHTCQCTSHIIYMYIHVRTYTGCSCHIQCTSSYIHVHVSTCAFSPPSLQDYFEIIRNPMDLRTIRNRLEAGEYNNPWEVRVGCSI